MKSLRSEILSMALILSVPMGIVISFPFGAFCFRATEGVRKPVRTAFVTLSPDAERQALRTVRASWQKKTGGARRLRAELLCAALPEDGRFSVLSVRDRSRLPAPQTVRCGLTPFLPSQKAPPPSPIAAEPAADPPAFSQKELLEMN